MAYTVESTFKVFDDVTGEYISIAPDGDGLGLLVMSSSENPAAAIMLSGEHARMLALALEKAADSLGDES
jgi:hypothetical protein